MTDEALSRAIAEFLEPKPSEHLCGGPFNNPFAWPNPYDCPACKYRGLVQPEFKFHLWKTAKWQPRDFINDPAMTVLLLFRLLEGHDVKFERGGNPNINLSYFDDSQWASIDAESIGRAVALAFARAHSLCDGTPENTRRSMQQNREKWQQCERSNETLSARVKQLETENARLSAEWQQVHDWNNKLVSEHYDLAARIRELESLAVTSTAEPCTLHPGCHIVHYVGEVMSVHLQTGGK